MTTTAVAAATTVFVAHELLDLFIIGGAGAFDGRRALERGSSASEQVTLDVGRFAEEFVAFGTGMAARTALHRGGFDQHTLF